VSFGVSGTYVAFPAQIASGIIPAASKMALVQTITKTASNTHTFDFTSLDINTDGYYVAYYSLETDASNAVYLEFEGDTTTTNYYTSYFEANNAAINAVRNNTNTFGYCAVSTGITGWCMIHRDNLGYLHAVAYSSNLAPANVKIGNYAIITVGAAANVTSITIKSPEHFVTGSTVSLYKVGRS